MWCNNDCNDDGGKGGNNVEDDNDNDEINQNDEVEDKDDNNEEHNLPGLSTWDLLGEHLSMKLQLEVSLHLVNHLHS